MQKNTVRILRSLIIMAIALALLLLAKTAYPLALGMLAEDSPVVEIQAENKNMYVASDTIRKCDFHVTAIHENGKTSTLPERGFSVSRKKPVPYGKHTVVTVSLKGDKGISCKVKLKNKRDKVASLPCGSPDINAVRAVLYSNGELCFEGKGEVVQKNDGEFLWQDSDHADSVRYVTFQDSVRPTSMDYFFSNMESLKYIAPIPETVTSMSGTFYGCSALVKAPDWEKCGSLLDISQCFAGCENLRKVPAIPSSVRVMTAAFQGCTALQDAPDLSGASSVVTADNAFEDCEQLAHVNLPPGVENIRNIFTGCINLKEMPEIPSSVLDMGEAFSGDISLSVLTSIPAHVMDVSSCFSGCHKIGGPLWVDANPEEYSGCFDNAAIATSVDLQGNSVILDVLANTGKNITVKGAAPNPDITSYEDVFTEE